MNGQPIGLIAGNGELPILVAHGAHAAGRKVICVGLAGNFDPRLPAVCDRFHVAGIIRIGQWVRLLRRAGVHETIMVGGVRKARMHDPFMWFRQIPDLRALKVWYRHLRHDRRNHAVLAAIANELASCGVPLMDSTSFIQDHLASAGVMGRVQPSAELKADADFGWPLISKLVELDVGQSIAVRNRDVIAVEAVEGTDAMIERAGELCRSTGWTLLKTAKAAHDRRADVPTVGVSTVERVAAHGCRCIAVGTGRVILVDRPAVVAAADRLGVALLGM